MLMVSDTRYYPNVITSGFKVQILKGVSCLCDGWWEIMSLDSFITCSGSPFCPDILAFWCHLLN